jgi:molecular chaperone Hsp33
MSDEILRGVIDDPDVRVVAAVTTRVAREAARRHQCVGGAQIALARAATTGLLLATMTKGDEQCTLTIAGDGPLGDINADALGDGAVRVYASNPALLAPVTASGPTRLARWVGGGGTVHVVRDLGLRERFTGQSPIISGEIDADVEHYLRTSEQIDSALGCDAVVDPVTEVRASAGLLVQCLPGAKGAELISQLRHRLRNGCLHAALVDQPHLAADVHALARFLLEDLAPGLRVLDRRPVVFRCRCSAERALSAVSSLPPDELAEMLAQDGGAEVTCDYCREVYRVDEESLRTVLHTAARRGQS